MWDTLNVRRVRAIITGRVQGVSYRAATADEARRLGITGWVRNRREGSVELEAQGAPEAITALLAWCAHGPPSARVAAVAVDELAPTASEPTFSVVG